jgi:hypothetical protein
MSKRLRIYREHALELLHNPQTVPDITFNHTPDVPIPYIDIRVASQDHPAFPLYLLMSAPQLYTKDMLTILQ